MTTTIDGSNSVTINSGAILGFTSGTVQASTSGTSIDFTSIPSWVKRITVMFAGVSLSGTAGLALQIGSGSVETSGYVGSTGTGNPQTGAGAWPTDRMTLQVNAVAAQTNHGLVTLATVGSNIWVESGAVGGSATDRSGNISTYTKTTSGTLDRIRITTTNGTDTFDAGSINILYE